jgi:hypothetical protein
MRGNFNGYSGFCMIVIEPFVVLRSRAIMD